MSENPMKPCLIRVSGVRSLSMKSLDSSGECCLRTAFEWMIVSVEMNNSAYVHCQFG